MKKKLIQDVNLGVIGITIKKHKKKKNKNELIKSALRTNPMDL